MKILKITTENIEICEVGEELADLQSIVGGYIEVVSIPYGMYLVCNEGGKLKGLPITMFYEGDAIAGNCFIVNSIREDFCSLTDVQIDFLHRKFLISSNLEMGKIANNNSQELNMSNENSADSTSNNIPNLNFALTNEEDDLINK